jgi:hypothetical protein
MRKPFKLFERDTDTFYCPTEKAKLILQGELIDHGIDDDQETDEEVIQIAKKKCKKELNKAIKDYLDGNPFE